VETVGAMLAIAKNERQGKGNLATDAWDGWDGKAKGQSGSTTDANGFTRMSTANGKTKENLPTMNANEWEINGEPHE